MFDFRRLPGHPTLGAVLLVLGLSARTPADERMNGMVGLYYSSTNLVAFEYDLIAQFWKSQETFGNITGPFLSEELSYRTNKFGGGMVVGTRVREKGTYALSASVFTENHWARFTRFETGYEAKVILLIFTAKVGMVGDDKRYFEVGLGY